MYMCNRDLLIRRYFFTSSYRLLFTRDYLHGVTISPRQLKRVFACKRIDDSQEMSPYSGEYEQPFDLISQDELKSFGI